MKVLITISYYLPNISGLTIYAQRLAENLVKRGHQVTILTSKHHSSLPIQEIINGVLVKRSFVLAHFDKGVLMPFFPLEAFKLVQWADVVNCHLPQPEAFWLLLFARIFGKKAIVTYQCDVRLPPGWTNWLINEALLMNNFLNCLLATTIINSSQDYAQNSPVLSKFQKKLTIIYPPIEDFRRVKITSEDKKVFPRDWERTKYKIGFVGRLAADKGVKYLLETIPFLEKQVDNFAIFIAGPEQAIGEKAYQEKIKSLIQQHQKNVFLLGKLTEQELAVFFQTIDVLVLPSINSTEAFGMAQVEAMLCGVPVIASNLPGVRLPVKLTGMGKIVPLKNSSQLCQAIIEVLKNKKSFVKPKSAIKKIFSLQKAIDSYEKIFF